MPGEDGLTVLRHIRGNVVTAGLPVVMLTGRRTSLDVASALALGVSGYVAKPFNPARLLALLRRLGHSTPERPGSDPR
jgi:two-component system alkaline phosphatase synthesis response regulator PhoP